MKVVICLMIFAMIGMEMQILNNIDGIEKAHAAEKLLASGLIELKGIK